MSQSTRIMLILIATAGLVACLNDGDRITGQDICNDAVAAFATRVVTCTGDTDQGESQKTSLLEQHTCIATDDNPGLDDCSADIMALSCDQLNFDLFQPNSASSCEDVFTPK